MKRIDQGKFYKVQLENGEQTILEFNNQTQLIIGKRYKTKDKGIIKVLSECRFKYTFNDVDNIRVMMEGYEEGTIQDNLRKRMEKAFKQPTPAVRFSLAEKEILSYIYYESKMLSEDKKETLRKILKGDKNG